MLKRYYVQVKCTKYVKTILWYIKAMFYTFCLKSYWCPLCGRILYNLKVHQSSASAPSHIMRGCSEKQLITLDPMSWSIKEVSMRRTRQSDYRALTLSLSHRSLTVGLRYSPWYVRGYPNTVRLHTWPKNGPSFNTEGIVKIPMSHRVVDQLSPHHDSQFSAFSTEVLIRTSHGTIAVVLPLLP